MRRINLITRDVETELFAGHPCDTLQRVASLDEARAVVEQGQVADGPATLDLIAHTTRDHKLLRVGADVLDMFKPPVRAFFERLAADGVLAAHGIVQVRLLGCESATKPSGRLTMARLSRTLGVPVFGATKPLIKSHFDRHGFNPAFEHILLAG
jgi:hypothetical protein